MSAVTDLLGREGRRLNFFGAVALLEEEWAARDISDPIAAGRIAFEPEPSLSFPSADIAAIVAHDDRTVLRLCFMGLAGALSPLPSYFSEYIVQHPAEAGALLDFLTIFNNRIYALFYRAWKKYRLTSIASAQDPRFRAIAALAAGTDDPSLLAYAGMLAGAPRSAAALAALISDRFGNIPVSIVEFMQREAPLPDPMRLGSNENARLGTTAILGTTMADRSAKFRVRVGPVKRKIFERFMPKSQNHAELKRLVEAFIAEPLDYDIEVFLDSAAMVPVILGADNTRLGETAALGRIIGHTEAKSMVIEGRSLGN
jgi:type VI secretion system protein ImpH